MDSEGMKLWIKKFLHSRQVDWERDSLFVCDIFEPHVTDRAKTALAREHTKNLNASCKFNYYLS